MRAKTIVFASIGAVIVGAVAYLALIVFEEPESNVKVKKRRVTPMPRGMAITRPAIGAPPAAQDDMPDYLLEGIRNPPKPFQARSEPAKNKELYRDVEGEELINRVNNMHISYRKREYRHVVNEAQQLLEEVPTNKQIRRILVRSACMVGKMELAEKHMVQLSASDQDYLRRHCKIYGNQY